MYDDEREEESGGRLFVILAIGLIGLLVLGLLGIGGVFVIRQNLEEQSIASRPTPNIPVRLPDPTQTFTPSPIPTETPAPTPTNTPVVGAEGAAASADEAAADRRESVSELAQAERRAEQETEAQGGEAATNSTPTRTPVPSAETAGAAETPAEVPNTGLGAMESVLIAAGLIAVFFIARRMRLAS